MVRQIREPQSDKPPPCGLAESLWLGLKGAPLERTQAGAAARSVTIGAARQRRTVTYGELPIAAYEVTEMKVGHNRSPSSP